MNERVKISVFRKFTDAQLQEWARKFLSVEDAKHVGACYMQANVLLALANYDEMVKRYCLGQNNLWAQRLWEEVQAIKNETVSANKIKSDILRLDTVDDVVAIEDAIKEKKKASAAVAHENPKLNFFLPLGDLSLAKWNNLGDKTPPFFNRQQAVLQLLLDCYKNHSQETGKNIFPLVATTAGFGKTRLMVEWPIRVFHMPTVVYSFLFDQRLETCNWKVEDLICPKEDRLKKFKVSTAKQQAFEERLKFLGKLHLCLKQQRIITTSAMPYPEKSAEELCETILTNEILRRFPVLKGNIDQLMLSYEKSVDDWLALLPQHAAGSRASKLYQLYNMQVDKVFYDPIFPDVQLDGVPILIINIDEIQVLMDRKLNGSNMASELLQKVTEIASHGTKPVKPSLVMMVGLKTGNLQELQNPTIGELRLSLPLNPLRNLHYLDELCKLTLGTTFLKTTGSTLIDQARWIIFVAWIRSLGIPRAIEYMFDEVACYKDYLVALTLESSVSNHLFDSISGRAQSYFTNPLWKQFGPSHGIEPSQWERICVEASLCVAKSPTAVINPANTNTEPSTYADLEAFSVLFPVQFAANIEANLALSEWQYTMPFYYFPDASEPVSILKSAFDKTEEELPQFKIKNPSFMDIVGSNLTYSNNSAKGDNLEHTTAVSLWARYRLKAQPGEFVQLCSLVTLPTVIRDATQVQPFDKFYVSIRGVLEAVQTACTRLNVQSVAQELVDLKAIMINKQKAPFLDVLVPLFIKDTSGEFKYNQLLAIQCQNTGTNIASIKPGSLVKEIQELNVDGCNMILTLMSPNFDASKKLSDRTETSEQFKELENNDLILLHNGDGWLSPLYLIMCRDQIEAFDEEGAVKEKINKATRAKQTVDDTPKKPTKRKQASNPTPASKKQNTGRK